MGQSIEVEFYKYSFDAPVISLMKNWPTKEEPELEYKFASFWLELKQDVVMIER